MQLKFQKTLKHLCSILLATFILTGVSSSYAQNAGDATVGVVSGYVTVTNKEGDVKRLESGDTLEEGDVVTTGENANASITLANGDVVNVSASSSYSLANNASNSAAYVGNSSGGDNTANSNNSSSRQSPSLSTATSAGGGISDSTTTTPPTGGSPN